jgi:hypothetical protein
VVKRRVNRRDGVRVHGLMNNTLGKRHASAQGAGEQDKSFFEHDALLY